MNTKSCGISLPLKRLDLQQLLYFISLLEISYIFNMLIKEYYIIHESEDDKVAVAPLTYQDMTALRYVAGKVCHSILKKTSTV